jgi:hypothetical protein
MQADARGEGEAKEYPSKNYGPLSVYYYFRSQLPPPPHLLGTSQGMSSWQENMEGVGLGARLQLLAKNFLLKRKKNNPSGAVMKEIDKKEEKLTLYKEILDVVL